MIGAALTGFVATLVVPAVVRTDRVKDDVVLGIVLPVFFGRARPADLGAVLPGCFPGRP